MLLGLNIRDIVLIDRLDLALRPGLCVLTGETGAGKSILLDALGLALGKRAESGLVRPGAQQAAVSAEFSVGRNHPAHAILREAGLNADGGALVLRRLVGADGRSRAFVNDEPASVGLLRELGDSLVEIQGQFEQRGLLDPANHRMILDAFAEHSVTPHALAKCWHDWREARQREADAARQLVASRDEEDLLRHHLAELDSLAPEEEEEDRLAAQRNLLQGAERLAETLTEAIGELDGSSGAQAALARAARRLERARERAQGLVDTAFAEAVEHVLGERDPAAGRCDAGELVHRSAVEPQPAGDGVVAEDAHVDDEAQVVGQAERGGQELGGVPAPAARVAALLREPDAGAAELEQLALGLPQRRQTERFLVADPEDVGVDEPEVLVEEFVRQSK